MKTLNKLIWKNRPLGIRIIIILLSINIILQFYSLTSKLQEPAILFGMFVNFPFSIVITLLLLVIPIIILFGIYKQKFWKGILILQGFNFINFLVGAIVILSTPLSILASKMGNSFPDVSPEILAVVEMKIKLLTSIPMFIGVIISLIILIYIYKKREYFLRSN